METGTKEIEISGMEILEMEILGIEILMTGQSYEETQNRLLMQLKTVVRQTATILKHLLLL